MNSTSEPMAQFKKYLDRTKMDHKQYQYDGVKWILNNELTLKPICNVRGGFIADEMGLGKTILMIGTFLCNFVPNTLVIVPPVLIDQWFAQIYRTTGHKPLIYHGQDKKKITIEQLKKAPIVISTYGAITLTKKQIIELKENTLLHKITWSRIVFDEAHHLRNSNTCLYISAKFLKSRIKWLVSGTPIQNSKKDFYSLCSMIGLPASFYSDAENLLPLARAFILKRTKKQVGIQMTNVILDKSMVSWSNHKEMELSKEIHSSLAFSHVSTEKPIVNSFIERGGVLSLMLRARQSCIYPKLMIKKLDSRDYSEAFKSSSKLDYVVGKILERKGNGCGKLIFCHFRGEIDEIARRLKAGGMKNVVTFDGRTTGGKRYDILNDANEAIILQIQTGCEGLNLQQNYSEIYFISPHWNPAIEDQAIARCHRIGQTKSVYVERFEMCSFDNSIDNSIDTINVEKYVGNIQEDKRLIYL
jgi:SNF2 family DNA or RNA helicase